MNADLTNARNPSAVVLSRIQRIRDDGQRDMHRQAVEEYLSRNAVDEVRCQGQEGDVFLQRGKTFY